MGDVKLNIGILPNLARARAVNYSLLAPKGLAMSSLELSGP